MQVKIFNPHITHSTILFFLGFGSNPNFFSHYINEAYHKTYRIIFVYDYKDNHLDLTFLQNQEVYLIAWSMGVAIANYFAPKNLNIKKSIAINGTNLGIHKTLGIPPAIFMHTIKHFNLLDFYVNVFDSKNFLDNIKDICKSQLILELQNLYTTLTTIPPKQSLWDYAITSQNDKIFQAKYQLQAWQSQNLSPIILPNSPHFIFFDYSLESLCNL
ncbi:DUF452 family protein [Helicobacter sp. faydin-H20]|uniref:pimeloyl-ACP methyl esterase BioG family protein n=1 Tax=Helicobacter anatolicus TaxID=2905874 RepID=UPI001E58B5C6|nr:pimeloyl-ACP methyl esterase BioG family protein [Helicobacter anatolicus]MCE3036326.1 DUF452 family protein [Helicobacter anatolicus]